MDMNSVKIEENYSFILALVNRNICFVIILIWRPVLAVMCNEV